MKKVVSQEKLGKKARKALDAQRRATWGFSPVTRKVESGKIYHRKRKSRAGYDDPGMGLSLFWILHDAFSKYCSAVL